MQFLKIPSEILQMDLQPLEKMLLAYLQGYKVERLYMTNKKIAQDLNISIKSIERSLAKLRNMNLILTNREGRRRIITLVEYPQKRGCNTLKNGVVIPSKTGVRTLKNGGQNPQKRGCLYIIIL